MNKLNKVTLSVLTSLNVFSCTSQVVNTTIKPYLSVENTNLNSSNVSVTVNSIGSKTFGIKNLDLSRIAKLKLEVRGIDFTPVSSQIVNYVQGQAMTLNVSVRIGKNRVVILQMLDQNENIITENTLMGVVDVIQNQNNVADISFFETKVAEIFLELFKGNNSNLLNSLTSNTVRTYLTNITGFIKASNTFNKLNPSLLNPVFLAQRIVSNNGNVTTEDIQNSKTKMTIAGDASFVLADSSGNISYTKDGNFQFDENGNLVNNENKSVLGVYDSTRTIINGFSFRDLANNAVLPGISVALQAGVNFGGTTLSTIASAAAVVRYFENPNPITFIPSIGLTEINTDDRVIMRNYVPAGALGATANLAVSSRNVGRIAGTTIQIGLTQQENTATRTSTDNARLIAKAVNAKSNITGIGASVIINKNNTSLATLVFAATNRIISEVSIPLDTSPFAVNLDTAIQTANVGLTKTYKDSKNNTFYAINSFLLSTANPSYQAVSGDDIRFDSKGDMINKTRGKDDASAPPTNTGVHIAIAKLTNNSPDEIGYAGQSNQTQINPQRGVEASGASTIGTGNTIANLLLP